MKRLILAALPLLLAAQIPLTATKIVPSEWKRSFHFGLKWTELLLNSYWSDSNDESDDDSIPDGVVTTTVVLASMPEFEQPVTIMVEEEMCQAQLEMAKKTVAALKIQRQFSKKFRMIQIKAKTIQL